MSMSWRGGENRAVPLGVGRWGPPPWRLRAQPGQWKKGHYGDCEAGPAGRSSSRRQVSRADDQSKARADKPMDMTICGMTMQAGGQWTNSPQATMGVMERQRTGTKTAKDTEPVSVSM